MSAAELDGQVVMVTGAAAGIGHEVASLLGARGARLALVDLARDAGAAAEDSLRAAGVECFFQRCDVTASVEVDAAVAAAEARYGRLDALVNNAGGPARKVPAWELDDDVWHAQLALNATSAFVASRAALRGMVARRSGSVVCLTSDQAFAPSPGRAAYAAAKAAVVGLVRALAVEAGPHGVRVNAVAPGPTLTEKTRQIVTEDQIAALAARHPLGRLAQPGDVAEMIAFLVGPRSRHVTGQVLHVSGGLLLP